MLTENKNKIKILHPAKIPPQNPRINNDVSDLKTPDSNSFPHEKTNKQTHKEYH